VQANPVEVNGEAGHHTDGLKLNDEVMENCCIYFSIISFEAL